LSVLSTDRFYRPDKFLVFIAVRAGVDTRTIEQPEGLCRWEIPVNRQTFRLVTQCNLVPHTELYSSFNQLVI